MKEKGRHAFKIPDTINRGVLGKLRVLWISAAVADGWKIRVQAYLQLFL